MILDKLLVNLVLITDMVFKRRLEAFGSNIGKLKDFVLWHVFALEESADVSDHFVEILSRLDPLLLQDWKSLRRIVGLLFVKEDLDTVLDDVDQDQEVLLNQDPFRSSERV